MSEDRDQDVTPAEPGKVIGHYQVIGELGRGGMGVLYRARDLKLDREVALKRPYPSLVPDIVQRQRFEREARAAAQLAHPHIVPIFEVLEQDGVPWLAMELVQGRSLRGLLDLGAPLSLPDVLRHAEALAGALQAAHERGILHRDVNPKNIMITDDGRALLMDFGLARLTRERTPDSESTETQENDVTRAGAVLGTPGYMSPEQALGRPADSRSDLFCLGAVIYEMCTSERAFSASDTGNMLDAVLHRDPPPPSRARPDAPPELDRIVGKLLSKEPGERYQGAADVVADLRALRRQVEWERYGSGRSLPGQAVPRPRPRRRRLLAVAALCAVMAAGYALCPTPAGVVNPHDRILLAKFDNETGNAAFDGTLREGLWAALYQSDYVNLLVDDQVNDALARMRRPAGTSLEVPLARELCEREGVRALFTGTIKRSGPVYRMEIRLVQAKDGALALTESEQFDDPSQIFSRVDALTRRIRKRLGESLLRIQGSSVPLERATTASIDALRLYSVARDASRRREMGSAEALLQQALAVDPRFALAYARLGDVYAVSGDGAKAVEAYGRAAGLTEGVSARERYVIDANYHQAREEYEEAVKSLRALVGLYPDDLAGHQELALAYESIGQRGSAIAELRECIRLDPQQPHNYGNLLLQLATDDQQDEAIKVYQEATAKGLDSPYLGWGLGLARLALGQGAEARKAFAGMVAAEPPFDSWGRLYLARADLFEGRWKQAAEQLAQDCIQYRERRNTSFEISSRNLLGRVRWLQGDRGGARRETDFVVAQPDELLRANELRSVGTLLAQMDAVEDARRVLARLERVAGSASSGFARSCVRNLEGEIALAEGRTAAAGAAFAAATAAYPHVASLLGAARVHQQRKEWAEAAAAWEKVIGARGQILRNGMPSDWCLAHLERARCLKQSGNAAEARREYGVFAELWRHADPSPLADDARREMERLEGRE